MSITVVISERLQLAGAGAAAVSAGAVSTEVYLQQILEGACLSYRDQFAVDRITSSDFIYRFTPTEFAAINASTDTVFQGFVAAVKSAPYVWLGAQQVIDGINYCVSTGYLTQPRADAILFYPIPSPTDQPVSVSSFSSGPVSVSNAQPATQSPGLISRILSAINPFS